MLLKCMLKVHLNTVCGCVWWGGVNGTSVMVNARRSSMWRHELHSCSSSSFFQPSAPALRQKGGLTDVTVLHQRLRKEAGESKVAIWPGCLTSELTHKLTQFLWSQGGATLAWRKTPSLGFDLTNVCIDVTRACGKVTHWDAWAQFQAAFSDGWSLTI